MRNEKICQTQFSKEALFNCFQEWEDSRGLVGFTDYNVSRSLQDFSIQLQELQSQTKNIPSVILVEPDPIKFIVYFFAGIISGVDLLICDPDWQTQEWDQVFKLVKPDLVLGNRAAVRPRARSTRKGTRTKRGGDRERAFAGARGRWGELGDGEIRRQGGRVGQGRDGTEQSIIGIPTGGSSGKIRFAVHTLSSLTASVSGFARYFATPQINSCCTLPLYHVSGLMQLWRCFITQGKLAIFPYKSLKKGKIPEITPENFFISLVPTQLKFLLDSNPHWLAKFHSILLGGAPAWRSLLEQARDYNLKLCPTYGMTETASGVVYLRSHDFLNQNNSSGKVLPHATVKIIDNQGKSLHSGEIGTIKIQADSLFCGYYPKLRTTKSLITDDLGYFDDQGFLYILGRKSQKIITGGKNVFPTEVETAILATGLVKDVCVIGLNDEQWGQVIISLFVPAENFNLNLLKQKLHGQLSKHKHPKNWLQVDSLPRSDRGKINYLKMAQLALQKLKN